jgi:hypothetical protein
MVKNLSQAVPLKRTIKLPHPLIIKSFSFPHANQDLGFVIYDAHTNLLIVL